MAYRFKLGEGIEAGVRRIAAGEIERAIASLGAKNGDEAVSVHDARKSIKRLRALLRLVRPALGEAVFRRENDSFRETSALLAHTRDTQILLETVAKLDARYKDTPHASLAKLHDALAAAQATPDRAAETAARDAAIQRLEKSKSRVSRLRLSSEGFEPVRDGLEQSFRKARRAFERSYRQPSDETVHEWRKGVQQHWRHMALLRRAWPELADARHNLARRLSQMLGDDHDLAILVQRLATTPAKELAAKDRRVITKLARQRQDELRALAKPYGERLHAEGPRGLARRFELYWAAATALRDTRTDGDAGEADAG